jgi:hypothetical protein
LADADDAAEAFCSELRLVTNPYVDAGGFTCLTGATREPLRRLLE